MTNLNVDIDPEELPKNVTQKYKNYAAIDKKVHRFYTLSGLKRLYQNNKLIFIILFLAWLLTFIWFIAD
ncbi:MAG: hypothetical protein U0V72_15520 [Cytophagales bacterium]